MVDGATLPQIQESDSTAQMGAGGTRGEQRPRGGQLTSCSYSSAVALLTFRIGREEPMMLCGRT
jgi:hypothetical protein